ncbi:histidine phosphatase family protein [Streptomyces sp. MBT97]|uniref:histidine phosphatase family protein n=1 Tax=Streptomyces sp. MBT97 TaxID=2800411 RepID=UPI00190DA714|nr:histidine phosphatase family protein [Streptomyces sp. MBT97]MBK3631954.1 histidine phosphatase family protein [Streptomyces sp. MBT97]
MRHGEADYERLSSYAPVYHGGRRDFAPLTDLGIRQAEAAAEQLRGSRPAVVVASPYARTLQTGAVIAAGLGCELRVEPALHDWLPVRDGAAPITGEIVRRKIEEYESWRRSGVLPSDRTWETDEEMADRVRDAMARHVTSGPLVAVTHEAVIKSATSADVVGLASVHRLTR